MQSTFTSREVVALTGISPRQLQWWDERGIVVPAREGHRRIYSRDDLAEIAVLCELRRRGFSLQIPGRLRARGGRPAEKCPSADVYGVPERCHPAGACAGTGCELAGGRRLNPGRDSAAPAPDSRCGACCCEAEWPRSSS